MQNDSPNWFQSCSPSLFLIFFSISNIHRSFLSRIFSCSILHFNKRQFFNDPLDQVHFILRRIKISIRLPHASNDFSKTIIGISFISQDRNLVFRKLMKLKRETFLFLVIFDGNVRKIRRLLYVELTLMNYHYRNWKVNICRKMWWEHSKEDYNRLWLPMEIITLTCFQFFIFDIVWFVQWLEIIS